MAARTKSMQRWVLSAVLAGVLGFGAAQALAAPTEQAGAAACARGPCDKACRESGNSGGICIEGQCICFIE